MNTQALENETKLKPRTMKRVNHYSYKDNPHWNVKNVGVSERDEGRVRESRSVSLSPTTTTLYAPLWTVHK